MMDPATRRSLRSAIALTGLALAWGCDAGAPRAGGSEPPREVAVSRSTGALPAVELRPAFPALAFERPVALTAAPADTSRVFVVEQFGRVRVVASAPAAEDAPVFLDIRDRVRAKQNEEGLLALAFHPAYRTNGYFYVYYVADGPLRGVLSRFSHPADAPGPVDPSTERYVLEVGQPWGNHNGASVLFGPDGFLYLSLGDGGSANDPLNAGQDLGTLLGKILRIDVDRPDERRLYSIPPDNPFVGREDARPEIWAYGLRNVWRMSFDPLTGDLWAGDVGQNDWEEVDRIVRGGNYGWRLREGPHPFLPEAGADTSALIDPVVAYGRDEGISVTGGHVYRGNRFPTLFGVYIYADYGSGRIWGLRFADGAIAAHAQIGEAGPGRFVTSFGIDARGELYACAFDRIDGRGSPSGRVYRVVAR